MNGEKKVMSNMRKPEWLKSKKLGTGTTRKITRYLRNYHLHSVCESAQCPNKGECFDRGTATFMILGNTCTRNCTFCAVPKSLTNLEAPDPAEPQAIADLAKELNLKHIVVTTVTRDDLPGGGADQFVKVIEAIRNTCDKSVSVEVLISDLEGNEEDIKKIVLAKPDVFNHNVETVPSLYENVRPMADYNRSLKVLQYAKKIDSNMLTKSGLMVGLGETQEEIINVMKDLRDINVDILTIGQYIAPSKNHFSVKEYVHPDIFEIYKIKGEELGFKLVESAPLVRSSYHAEYAKDFLKNK